MQSNLFRKCLRYNSEDIILYFPFWGFKRGLGGVWEGFERESVCEKMYPLHVTIL